MKQEHPDLSIRGCSLPSLRKIILLNFPYNKLPLKHYLRDGAKLKAEDFFYAQREYELTELAHITQGYWGWLDQADKERQVAVVLYTHFGRWDRSSVPPEEEVDLKCLKIDCPTFRAWQHPPLNSLIFPPSESGKSTPITRSLSHDDDQLLVRAAVRLLSHGVPSKLLVLQTDHFHFWIEQLYPAEVQYNLRRDMSMALSSVEKSVLDFGTSILQGLILGNDTKYSKRYRRETRSSWTMSLCS